jgi:hypothetical protein
LQPASPPRVPLHVAAAVGERKSATIDLASSSSHAGFGLRGARFFFFV